jgi:TolA-binding protein
MSGFMEKLRMKVEQLTPQKQVSTTTAVGGVRGSAVAAADVYWKGEAKPQTIDAAELEAFQKGVALVESDQKAQALAVFTEFSKTYPESLLKADAEEIMRHLAQQPVAQ